MKKSKTIKISQELYDHLKENSLDLTDTFEAVLQRLLFQRENRRWEFPTRISRKTKVKTLIDPDNFRQAPRRLKK